MMSARTNAMRMSPGTSPRKAGGGIPDVPSSASAPGSGARAGVDGLHRSRVPAVGPTPAAARRRLRGDQGRTRTTSTALNDAQTWVPRARSKRATEPSVISAINGGAGQTDACALAVDRDLGHRPRDRVACGSLGTVRVEHHVGRSEHAEHAVGSGVRRTVGGTTTSPSSVTKRARSVVEWLQPAGEQVHAHQVGHVRRPWRSVAELFGRAALRDLAALHHDDPIRDGHRLDRIVRDQHDARRRTRPGSIGSAGGAPSGRGRRATRSARRAAAGAVRGSGRARARRVAPRRPRARSAARPRAPPGTRAG